ncbi:acyl-CoA thioesterase II [Nocardioides islandensis]|jgi:acyl-CoA thioesterase-2|uniref:Acyl-CoA thioesterase 2 n=1 Tax=Nocardioides islandensis TaxID=433663 RepID=A0A930VEB7_9ACTN|nr:acyl-CoA thioesterase II [Nocardioides islandensis]MBF4765939.1 acyl-CoA thioesterase II [Nocardioides islandensis]
MPASSDELVELLDLESLDVDLFRGRQPDTERQRVFGGQVAAQALIAGIRTTDDDLHVHSLHSYFLRPGDTAVPIIYDVERLRDGRSFSTRRIVARQHGHPIYFMTANFQRLEEGFEHQDAMPAVSGGPDAGIEFATLAAGRGGTSESFAREWAALDVRYLANSDHNLTDDPSRPARAQLWIRVNGRLSDDPAEHLATFTYASDMTLLGATLVGHGVTIGDPRLQPASLDHSIWFHRPFRADEWWLYDQWSPSASGARGLALARVFTEDGTLVATVAQEGLIRMRG